MTATYLDMYNGERIRVAEKDDNSAEFNDAIYKALSAGSFTKAEYNRIVDTDVIIRGSRIGDARPVYAAIEASYSLNNRDIDKVCQSATLIRRIFPNSEVHSVLYYMRRPNAEIEQEAVSRGVTLTVSRTLT